LQNPMCRQTLPTDGSQRTPVRFISPSESVVSLAYSRPFSIPLSSSTSRSDPRPRVSMRSIVFRAHRRDHRAAMKQYSNCRGATESHHRHSRVIGLNGRAARHRHDSMRSVLLDVRRSRPLLAELHIQTVAVIGSLDLQIRRPAQAPSS
jgi:hypothetical protein